MGGTDFGTIHELLRQTQLRLTVVEANAAKATSLRELLTASGYYGERVTVHHHANPLTFSAPPHFANLVMVRGKTAHNLTEKSLINIFQSVRPYGGVLCVENAPTALIKTEIADAEIQWEAIMMCASFAQARCRARRIGRTSTAMRGSRWFPRTNA